MTETTAAAPPPPLITVIVAVHDVAGFIGPCLRSLAAQELADFEVLVIDDGSTDSSRTEALAAVAGDARFQVLSFANGGLSVARNRGLDLARGAFVAFVDGDDRVEPGYLGRMHAALVADGGDWVACGLRFVSLAGEMGPPLSALHGPAAPQPDGPVRHPLGDWREVIRHYPSAWNKLYRRDLIGALRFDEGTYYEDHSFFWQLATRTPYLLRLPDPLYLQTQGRSGQITRDGSDRVFEQFSVLDRLRGIMATAGGTGGDAAFARIASRLIFERSLAISNPARRSHFAATARAFLARHAITWSPEWDPGIGRGFGLMLAGLLPVSVVVPTDGAPGPLAATLEALAAQGLRDVEVLIAPDGPAAAAALDPLALHVGVRILPAPAAPPAPPAARVAAARNRGLAAAIGVFVIFLDAGDRPQPWALGQWQDAMLRHGPKGEGTDGGADMGFFRFVPGPGAPVHSGFHDMNGLHDRLVPGAFAMDAETALRLHPHPSAKIFRRSFLLDHALRFAPHALQSWQFTLQAALLARAVVHVPQAGVILDPTPGSRRFWQAAMPAADLARALDAVITAAEALRADWPDGWERRLFARALWEKLNFAVFAEGEAEIFAAEARTELAARSLSGTQQTGALDPYVGPRILAILAG